MTQNAINNTASTLTVGNATSTNNISIVRSVEGQWLDMDDQTDTFGIYNSTGTPEGGIAANIGSLATDTTNGALYIKQTDTANTGWAAIGGGSGHIVKSFFTSSSTPFQTGAIIPVDNTIPQITEGAQVITQAYTPIDGANNLLITLAGSCILGAAISLATLCVFEQGTNNAISTILLAGTAVNHISPFTFTSLVPATDTSSRTYEFRAGVAAGPSTININADTAGGAIFGGTGVLLLSILEILP